MQPALRTAPITAAIVVLVGSGVAATLRTALTRTLEIPIGTLIGLATAYFVFPARAVAFDITGRRWAGSADELVPGVRSGSHLALATSPDRRSRALDAALDAPGAAPRGSSEAKQKDVPFS